MEGQFVTIIVRSRLFRYLRPYFSDPTPPWISASPAALRRPPPPHLQTLRTPPLRTITTRMAAPTAPATIAATQCTHGGSPYPKPVLASTFSLIFSPSTTPPPPSCHSPSSPTPIAPRALCFSLSRLTPPSLLHSQFPLPAPAKIPCATGCTILSLAAIPISALLSSRSFLSCAPSTFLESTRLRPLPRRLFRGSRLFFSLFTLPKLKLEVGSRY